MKREAIKKENKRIHFKNMEYNAKHKERCSFYNWRARIIGFLDFKKKVYPVPSAKEIEAFIEKTGYVIKLKGGLKNDNK